MTDELEKDKPVDETTKSEFMIDDTAAEVKPEEISLDDRLAELTNIDFNDNFDVDKWQEDLLKWQEVNTTRQDDKAKIMNANKNIDTLSKKFDLDEFRQMFRNFTENILTFLRKYDKDSEFMVNLNAEAAKITDVVERNKFRDAELDKIFLIGKYLFTKMGTDINKIYFTFPVTYEQLKWIINLLKHKLRYNPATELPTYRKVRAQFITDCESLMMAQPKGGNSKNSIVNVIGTVHDLISIYYFIQKYEINGSNEDYENMIVYLDILKDMNDLYTNGYRVAFDQLWNNFELWTSAISVSNEFGAAVNPAEATAEVVTGEKLEAAAK